MTIGEAIRTHALSDASIDAAIGARFYPVAEAPAAEVDEAQPDTVLYSLLNEEIDQFISADALWARSLYGFTVVCDPRTESATGAYDRCQTITDLLLVRFHAYRGVMGGGGGVTVREVRQVDRSDDFDFETGLVIKRQQFEIKWRVT